MNFKLVVKEDAFAEIAEIHAYHKGIGQDLADRFQKDLAACLAFIEQQPNGFQVRVKNYRHAKLRKFRYRVVFAVMDQEVVVFQVRHTSRRPNKEFGP